MSNSFCSNRYIELQEYSTTDDLVILSSILAGKSSYCTFRYIARNVNVDTHFWNVHNSQQHDCCFESIFWQKSKGISYSDFGGHNYSFLYIAKDKYVSFPEIVEFLH